MTDMGGKTVILGTFDGVHTGHAALFDIAKIIKSDTVCVYTFKNHPAEFITGKKIPLLLTQDERMRKLRSMGADEIIAVDFDDRLCATSPDDFAVFIKEKLGADNVIAGYNYTFGAHGAGGASDLVDFGRKYGFMTYIAEPVLYEGEPVSSTRIREDIQSGNVESASVMLGEPFRMSGTVERCRQVGRLMGYPTANIRNTEGKALPLFGVYATLTHIGKRRFASITNVGTNPTFGEADVSIETHIFDFDEDIYGEYIGVDFLYFVRGQRRFSDMDELKRQITEDSEKVRSRINL